MANYYASARSNYFHVKDVDTFIKAMPSGIGIWNDREDGRVGVYDDGGDGSGWPNCTFDDDSYDQTEFWFPDLVASHLQDGEVAIFMEAGAEKLRYVSGEATAINSKGEFRLISLRDIYKLAEELGEHIEAAEY